MLVHVPRAYNRLTNEITYILKHFKSDFYFLNYSPIAAENNIRTIVADMTSNSKIHFIKRV